MHSRVSMDAPPTTAFTHTHTHTHTHACICVRTFAGGRIDENGMVCTVQHPHPSRGPAHNRLHACALREKEGYTD